MLAFARVGSVRGDSYRIYVTADEAHGVIEGSEVWLAGQKVGVVDEIEFRPVTADTLGRLALVLDLEMRYQSAIRRDSRAEFRNGTTPIGATIVSISLGSPSSPMLRPHDTLSRAPQIDPDSVRAALSTAASQMPDLLRDARALISGFRDALGPLSDFRPSTTGTISAGTRHHPDPTRSAMHGAFARIYSDTSLHKRAKRIATDANTLLRAVDSGGTLGAARNEAALGRAMLDLRLKISLIQRQLDEERGTAGRLLHDHALARQLRILEERLRGATTDQSAGNANGATRH